MRSKFILSSPCIDFLLVSLQTSQILTWAAINPVAALSYFASARLNQIANSYTIQFASRMLYTTKSEALILYIPQLVQAVRYDEVRETESIVCREKHHDH